jgi:hypothetical protein
MRRPVGSSLGVVRVASVAGTQVPLSLSICSTGLQASALPVFASPRLSATPMDGERRADSEGTAATPFLQGPLSVVRQVPRHLLNGLIVRALLLGASLPPHDACEALTGRMRRRTEVSPTPRSQRSVGARLAPSALIRNEIYAESTTMMPAATITENVSTPPPDFVGQLLTGEALRNGDSFRMDSASFEPSRCVLPRLDRRDAGYDSAESDMGVGQVPSQGPRRVPGPCAVSPKGGLGGSRRMAARTPFRDQASLTAAALTPMKG